MSSCFAAAAASIDDSRLAEINSWGYIGSDPFSFRRLWKLEGVYQADADPGSYVGGSDGTVIARYISSSSPCRLVVYDLRFRELYTYEMGGCDKVYVYVAPNDYVYALTKTGILTCFFAGRELFRRNILNRANILAASFWATGFVCVVMKNEEKRMFFDVYWSNDFRHAKLLCADVDSGAVTICRVIPPSLCRSNTPTVFMIDYRQELLVVNENDSWAMKVDVDGCGLLAIEFSSDFSLVSFMCENNVLIVASSTLDNTFLSYRIHDAGVFRQLAWVGSECPIVRFDTCACLIGNGQDEVVLSHESRKVKDPLLLIPCGDSCLIVTSNDVFRVEMVQSEVASIASDSSGVRALVDVAIKRSTLDILGIRDRLKDMINSCVQAAAQASEVDTQRMFLSTALFGVAYSLEKDENIHSEISRVSTYLRVKNALRNELSMVVPGFKMFQKFDTSVNSDIVMRICGRKDFGLALEISDFLGLDRRTVIAEWCCAVAKSLRSDDMAFRVIQQKAQNNESFDITVISNALYNEGEKTLSERLTELEPNKNRLCRSFMKQERWPEAINAAIGAGNTQLLLHVMTNPAAEDATRAAIACEATAFATLSKFAGYKKSPMSDLVDRALVAPLTAEFALRRILHRIETAETVLGLENRAADVVALSTNMKWDSRQLKLVEFHLKVRSSEDAMVKRFTDWNFINTPLNGMLRALARQSVDDAITLGSEHGMKHDGLYTLIARTIAEAKNWPNFLSLAKIRSFAPYWDFCILLTRLHFGDQYVESFIGIIDDEKQRGKLQKSHDPKQPKELHLAFMEYHPTRWSGPRTLFNS